MAKKQETSILVQCSVRVWGAKVGDKRIASDLAAELDADMGTLTVLKQLTPAGWLKPIRELAVQAYALHRAFTMPIPQYKGTGIMELPVKHFARFEEMMNKVIPAFEAEREKLVSEYPGILADAPRRLGKAFDVSKFPDPNNPDDFRKRFSIEIRYIPYPDSDNLPRTLDPEDIARITKAIEEQAQVTATAQRLDVLQRILEPLQHMAQRIKAVDDQLAGGPKTKLHESVFENLREVIDLPIIRDHEDPTIKAIRDEIDSMLSNVDSGLVKGSAIARKQTMSKAEELSDKLSALI